MKWVFGTLRSSPPFCCGGCLCIHVCGRDCAHLFLLSRIDESQEAPVVAQLRFIRLAGTWPFACSSVEISSVGGCPGQKSVVVCVCVSFGSVCFSAGVSGHGRASTCMNGRCFFSFPQFGSRRIVQRGRVCSVRRAVWLCGQSCAMDLMPVSCIGLGGWDSPSKLMNAQSRP